MRGLNGRNATDDMRVIVQSTPSDVELGLKIETIGTELQAIDQALDDEGTYLGMVDKVRDQLCVCVQCECGRDCPCKFYVFRMSKNPQCYDSFLVDPGQRGAWYVTVYLQRGRDDELLFRCLPCSTCSRAVGPSCLC